MTQTCSKYLLSSCVERKDLWLATKQESYSAPKLARSLSGFTKSAAEMQDSIATHRAYSSRQSSSCKEDLISASRRRGAIFTPTLRYWSVRTTYSPRSRGLKGFATRRDACIPCFSPSAAELFGCLHQELSAKPPQEAPDHPASLSTASIPSTPVDRRSPTDPSHKSFSCSAKLERGRRSDVRLGNTPIRSRVSSE
jgi:hypothetical protein